MKNVDVYNDPLFKAIKSKGHCMIPAGVVKEKNCNKNLKLTGLSNSGG